MFDEKNIYVRQAEVKGSFKQNNNGTFLLNELTVNSTLKNYKKILNESFTITLEELKIRNAEYDKEKEKKQKTAKKETKARM
jgi:hypothetical protein